jgi:hypothetical protein
MYNDFLPIMIHDELYVLDMDSEVTNKGILEAIT